jgi:hypothetical protein
LCPYIGGMTGSAPPVRQPEEAPFFGVPPARQHRRITEGAAVNGKRVILSNEEGFWYDMRAVGEPFRDDQGVLVVWVLAEVDWYEWLFKPAGTLLPYDRAECWPASLVYID